MAMKTSFRRNLSTQQGFTLIELLIVVAIIAILAAILIPTFLRARAQAQVAATKGNLKNVATALESYFVDFAMYPQDPTALVTNYDRALPPDPCTGAAFNASNGYSYSTPSNPATDYVLRSNWSATGAGAACYNVTPPNGSNWQYTPGAGSSGTVRRGVAGPSVPARSICAGGSSRRYLALLATRGAGTG